VINRGVHHISSGIPLYCATCAQSVKLLRFLKGRATRILVLSGVRVNGEGEVLFRGPHGNSLARRERKVARQLLPMVKCTVFFFYTKIRELAAHARVAVRKWRP
jgi:hypothetical protein